MTERNELLLAALTSAALPSVVVAGVFPGATHANGIDQAQVRDVTGKTYDVYASDTEEGRGKLAARVKAAKALAAAREPGGLGFALDRVLGFAPGDDPKGPTGSTAVMVAMHQDGKERPLDLLTLDDCAAMGTAIGAIHRLNPSFLREAGYPLYATGQIRAQLTAWIARLKNAGHVPPEITSSWAKILETEGLWSFNTCMVHGGFEDGDVRFSGSTITAVNNWQNMQVNDPARDLAWIFSKLDEDHRNAVLTAYGRMMGNRLDGLIMLRANLWVQMEQVGDFIQALNEADSQKIIRFKAQVDRLAHQLGVTARAAEPKPGSFAPGGRRMSPNGEATREKPPSTITVGTLLKDGERRRAAAETAARAAAPAPGADRTGQAGIVAAGRVAVPGDATDDTARTPVKAAGTVPTAGTGATRPQPSAYASMPAPSSSATITLGGVPGAPEATDPDDTDERDIPHDGAREPDPDTSATIVIPLLEREERALRDARAGLDFDDETFDDEPRAAGDYAADAASTGVPSPGAASGAAMPAQSPAADAAGTADADVSDDTNDVPVVVPAPAGYDPDDTPSVTPVVVAAPLVAVHASTGTVEPTPVPADDDVATHTDGGPGDAEDADDTGEAHTVPADPATPTA
ncbi:phosphotransferase [Bifidobacterium platyrrhinorum]|uniref:phosphotransferase n=1 Tax=Bifidobacterium platyrrhinorum TaxID=2661628 RepID=UPI00298CC979|nr:phosphotransferase [Bifidobacterium platyrrhinorum]